MKTSIAKISLCVMFALAVVLGGCRKKTDEETQPVDQTNSTKTSISEFGGKVIEKAKEAGAKAGETAVEIKEKTVETAVEIKEKTVETAVEIKEKAAEKVFSIVQQFKADQGKSIPDITAQTKEMAVENLRRMAEKYRDVIAEKQEQLREMTQKFIDLSDAERTTGEGQILKAGVDKIKEGVEMLKERFGVYYNALKEKAGNLTGLDI